MDKIRAEINGIVGPPCPQALDADLTVALRRDRPVSRDLD